MAAFKNVPASTSEPQSAMETSSTDNSPAEQEYIEQEYTEQEYLFLNDNLLPANNPLYPLRTSSLQPPPNSHPNSRNCEEPDHTVFDVVQSQLSHIFLRSKDKVAALFSSKSTPQHQSDCITPETSTKPTPNHLQQAQQGLTPVPGRRNKFWLGVPSQRAKDRAEKKMMRRMSHHTRERRSVTAESAKKMLELEEERVAVRDFQAEHDEAKEEVKAKEVEGEAEAKEEKAKEAEKLQK